MFEISLFGAALAGLLSFLSPCILPIVPFYLSYMAGAGINQLQDGGTTPPGVRRKAVMSAIAFSLGVVTIFVALGAGATAFGRFVADWFDVMRIAAAVLIGVMGLHFLGLVRIPILYRQFRAEAGDTGNMTLLGAYVIGLAFAFGWTPCVGPVLAAILMTAAGAGDVGRGMLLLFIYGLGMTLPFVLAAFFIGPFLRWAAGFRRHLGMVEKIMGALLLVFAILIGTNTINWIANWMVIYWPSIG